MPISARTLLCARLQVAAYDPTFLATGKVDLSLFGRTLVGIIWANDPKVGRVRHGFISTGPEGPIWTFAGTLMPDGSIVEWLDDFDAVLTPSPWHPADRVHRGFLRFFNSLTVEINFVESPIQHVIAANPGLVAGAIFIGHSLGTSSAIYAFLEAFMAGLRPAGWIVIAAPKPGDTSFRQTIIDATQEIEAFGESYANPNDAVPRVPLTVDFPFKVEDFQPVIEPIELQPTLVTPSIPADWASSHHMDSYMSLLEAAA